MVDTTSNPASPLRRGLLDAARSAAVAIGSLALGTAAVLGFVFAGIALA